MLDLTVNEPASLQENEKSAEPVTGQMILEELQAEPERLSLGVTQMIGEEQGLP